MSAICENNLDTSVNTLIFEKETPLYVYNLSRLRERITELRSVFDVPLFTLLFATMANDRPEVLRAIAQEGVGACVNSMQHLDLALSMGFSQSLIQFTSTGIPLSNMPMLKDKRIVVNLDSPYQVAQWCHIMGGGKVGLRVNAASLLGAHKGDRIGMDVMDLPIAIQESSSRGGVVNGLHVYVGTNFQSADEMLPTLRAFFELAASIPQLEYVNIGGGIGVDYMHNGNGFNLPKFGAEVSALTQRLEKRIGRPVTLFFEPGRGLVASSGTFFTRITDIKRLHKTTYVTVDASIAIFPRPFHHPNSPHRVQIVGKTDGFDCLEEVTVVGRTTFSRDILAQCKLPSTVEIGDLLIFDDAGAYCQSMISRFLGQGEPAYLVLEQ